MTGKLFTYHWLFVIVFTLIPKNWYTVYQIFGTKVNLLFSSSPSDDSFALGSWNCTYQNVGIPSWSRSWYQHSRWWWGNYMWPYIPVYYIKFELASFPARYCINLSDVINLVNFKFLRFLQWIFLACSVDNLIPPSEISLTYEKVFQFESQWLCISALP